jgi:hypothetical protein
MLEVSFIEAADDAPPLLELAELSERGLTFIDLGDVAEALEAHNLRRRLLRGFVEHDGWAWPQAVWMEGELTGGAELALHPTEHMASRTDDEALVRQRDEETTPPP